MRLIFIFGLILLAAGAAFPASATTVTVLGDTAQYGGTGGGDFREQCGDQDVLIGVNLTVGKDINSISPVCKGQQNGVPYGPSYFLHTWGDANDEEAWAVCGQGEVMQGVYIAKSNAQILHHLELRCRDVSTGQVYKRHILHDNSITLTHGGEAVGEPDFANCGSGAFAVGIFGGYGANVDRLGLICGKFEQAAAPQQQDQTAPSPSGPPEKPIKSTGKGGQNTAPANNGPNLKPTDNGAGGNTNADQDDNGGNNNAGGASAAVDTTIYDQPDGNDLDYLSAGDPVTIVSCNDDNWCKISAPRKGWVWGDDLDR